MKFFTNSGILFLIVTVGSFAYAMGSGGKASTAGSHALMESQKALVAVLVIPAASVAGRPDIVSKAAANSAVASGRAVTASGEAVVHSMTVPMQILETSVKTGAELVVTTVEFLANDVLVTLATLGTDVLSLILQVPREAFESSLANNPEALAKMQKGEEVAVNTRSLEVKSETGDDVIGYVVFLADVQPEVPVGVVLNDKGEAIYAPN